MKGMTEKDVILALKTSVKKELESEADKIIEKQVEIFRLELTKKKNSIIAGMINGLEILVNQELKSQNVTFKINFTSEKR